MKENKIEFGIKIYGTNNIHENICLIKKAEDMGFTHCWITEDYFNGGVFSLAAACAVNTTKIKIGTGVVNPFTRHPVLTAMEFGSFDLISNGRGILGIGTSRKEWIEERMGIHYNKPQKKLEESLLIIKKLLSKEQFTFSGEAFNVNKIKLSFDPYRKNIPIYLAGKGPKGLRLAAKLGDGVLLTMMSSKSYIQYARKQIFEELKENNKIDHFKVAAYLIINISKNRKKAREQVKPLISRYIGIYGVHPVITTSGIQEKEIIPFKKALSERKDASNLVTDELIDIFSIAGEKDECIEKISSLAKTGTTYPIVSLIPGVPMDDTLKIISENLIK